MGLNMATRRSVRLTCASASRFRSARKDAVEAQVFRALSSLLTGSMIAEMAALARSAMAGFTVSRLEKRYNPGAPVMAWAIPSVYGSEIRTALRALSCNQWPALRSLAS